MTELRERLEQGLPVEDEHWETALRSPDPGLRRAALRSAHLPARWFWEELRAGAPDAD